MNRKKREQLLKIGAIAIVALFLLDRIVFTPAIAHWKEQSDHIAELNDKVTKGHQLIARAKSLNDRWAEMLRTGLKDNRAVAENDVYRAISRWGIASRVAFSSLTPLWRAHEDEGYDTLEIRGIANGDQSSLARLLFELETDPLPARVSELEMSTRDTQGKQLAMQLRFSFVHLTPQAAQPPRRGDSSSR